MGSCRHDVILTDIPVESRGCVDDEQQRREQQHPNRQGPEEVPETSPRGFVLQFSSVQVIS